MLLRLPHDAGRTQSGWLGHRDRVRGFCVLQRLSHDISSTQGDWGDYALESMMSTTKTMVSVPLILGGRPLAP